MTLSKTQQAEEIVRRHFNQAARAAELELRPLLIQAVKELHAKLPVESVRAAGGTLSIVFKGRLKKYGYYDLTTHRPSKARITEEQLDALDNFLALANVLADWREVFCFIEPITKDDLK